VPTPVTVTVPGIDLKPLPYPGVNPGYVLGAVRPAYQTTQPYQQQFYWGQQPYFYQMQDLARYNQIPGGLPAAETQPVPYYAQPAAYELPIYGPDMTILNPPKVTR